MARALWFVGPRQAELREEEVVDPGPGEVQVAGICALVSAGSELNLYRGEGNNPGVMLPTSRGQLPFPVKFGYQEVGEVVAVGEGSGLSVGDRVLCQHPHQDLFTLDASYAFRLPPDLPPERAAFNLIRIALIALQTSPVLVGDAVAVSGLGVVGAFVAHLARSNAGRLIAIDPSPSRRELAAWIGADAVVDPAAAPGVIDELTDGRGVDVFYEASGAPPALQTAIESTATEGTIAVASWYGTRPVELLLSPEFHVRRPRVVATGPMTPAHLAPRWSADRLRKAAWELLAELPAEEHMITHRVPFEQAAEAYALLDRPESGALAVLLEH